MRAWLALPFRRGCPGAGEVPDRARVARLWQPCQRPEALAPQRALRLLETRPLLGGPTAGEAQAATALALRSLHAFDDLVADEFVDRGDDHEALIERWLATNPPCEGDAWRARATSLRIVNWIRWTWAGGRLSRAARASLALQARWLRRRIEWHLPGHRLWANGKALAFAGCFFEGEEADGWLSAGLDILERELDLQVLTDGGHVERSPMIHASFLEDVLDLVQLASLVPRERLVEFRRRLEAIAPALFRWLWAMSHPDGDFAFFNDSPIGRAPCFGSLVDHALRLGLDSPPANHPSLLHLDRSGYVMASRGPFRLVADVAPVGADHLPRHAHADTLAFELAVDGRRLIVNAGTSTYAAGAQRERERGTASHTTVEIDGEDSSETWGAFQVARRAHPFGVSCRETPEEIVITGAHDGYRRLSGRPVHRRAWKLRGDRLRIEDRIDGSFERAVARYHFHPEVDVSLHVASGFIDVGQRKLAWAALGASGIALVEGRWHPTLGESIPCKVLEIEIADAALSFEIRV